MLFDVIGDIVFETDNHPCPFFALLRLPCRWRRSVWRTTRSVWYRFFALLRLPRVCRQSVWQTTRRVRYIHRMPTHLQNFLITKASVEEFLEQLLVTRAIGHASPSQSTASNHSQQPPRTHSTPPSVEAGAE